MQNTYQLSLNMKYREKEFYLWIPKDTFKITNYILKYSERKQTAKPFLNQLRASKIAKIQNPI